MSNWIYPLWVIIDVLIFLCVIAMWVTAPEYTALNIGLTTFAVTLAALLAVYRLKEIKVFVNSTYFARLIYHIINVVLIFSIVGLINYLGNKNFKEFDLTDTKKNSLTEQSKKVVEMVEEPLQLTVYSKRELWTPILAMLKLYQAQNPKIKINAIDTDVRPDLVKEKGITQDGMVIVQYKGKETKFQATDELAITNALLKVLRDENIVLYFVTGHQELSCEEQGLEGISILCDKLRGQNYKVKNINLATTKSIPEDASAVFVLGPIEGYFSDEAKQLQEYLKSGGSVFLALAPAFKSELYDNLTELARPYGLKLGEDIVIDRLSTVQGAEATIPIISKYSDHHPITAEFNLRTVFPLSSSVSTLPGNDSAHILAKTSDYPGSWAETNLKAVVGGKAEFNEGKDERGPVGVMGVGERVGDARNTDSRFVLLGSSSFLVNAYQPQSGNTTLFLNSASWLVSDEGIMSLNRPGLEEAPVILSAAHLQMIFVISILVVPIVFFGAGIFVYRRRRVL